MTKLTAVPGADRGPLAALVEDYIASCKARGLSPNTLQNSYGYPLRKVLLPFCEREGIHEPTELTSRALDRLAGPLMDEGGSRGPLSRHSVHAYIRAIKHFLAWAEREGEPLRAKALLPRLPRAVLEVLSREEIQAMEDAARSERDKLIHPHACRYRHAGGGAGEVADRRHHVLGPAALSARRRPQRWRRQGGQVVPGAHPAPLRARAQIR